MSIPICLSSLCRTTAIELPIVSPETVSSVTLKPFGYFDAFISAFALSRSNG